MKIKASKNTAKQVETRPPNQTIEKMTSEDLGLEKDRQYAAIMQAKDSIFFINQELIKRKAQNEQRKKL